MKPQIFTCLLLGCLPLPAQSEDIASEETIQIPLVESAARPAPTVAAVPSIIGPLAGEPRPAPTRPAIPPPPRLHIPAQNTLKSEIHDFGDHTVTIEEVIPVALPPHPEPPAALTAAQREASGQSRPARSKIESLNLSTTVYDRRATLIDWTSKDHTQRFRAWSNIDFNYLRGITNIQLGDTHLIYFDLGFGDVDTKWMTARHARFNRVYQKPIIPELPASPETNPTFVIIKGEPGPEDLAGIQVLHDLYQAEHVRLKAAFDYQKIQNELHAADLLANPPQAPDLILKHWTISKQTTVPTQKGETAR